MFYGGHCFWSYTCSYVLCCYFQTCPHGCKSWENTRVLFVCVCKGRYIYAKGVIMKYIRFRLDKIPLKRVFYGNISRIAAILHSRHSSWILGKRAKSEGAKPGEKDVVVNAGKAKQKNAFLSCSLPVHDNTQHSWGVLIWILSSTHLS